MKLSFCPFCAYVGRGGGNNLSYLNHIIIVHYNASYGCGKCLKQALHNHKKVCLGLTSRKSAGVLDGKPSSGGCNRMARLPPPIPKAQVPLLPLNHHHAAVDGRPPATTRSHKKDSGEKKKKANEMSPAWKSTEHKVHKDGGRR